MGDAGGGGRLFDVPLGCGEPVVCGRVDKTFRPYVPGRMSLMPASIADWVNIIWRGSCLSWLTRWLISGRFWRCIPRSVALRRMTED